MLRLCLLVLAILLLSGCGPGDHEYSEDVRISTLAHPLVAGASSKIDISVTSRGFGRLTDISVDSIEASPSDLLEFEPLEHDMPRLKFHTDRPGVVTIRAYVTVSDSNGTVKRMYNEVDVEVVEPEVVLIRDGCEETHGQSVVHLYEDSPNRAYFLDILATDVDDRRLGGDDDRHVQAVGPEGTANAYVNFGGGGNMFAIMSEVGDGEVSFSSERYAFERTIIGRHLSQVDGIAVGEPQTFSGEYYTLAVGLTVGDQAACNRSIPGVWIHARTLTPEVCEFFGFADDPSRARADRAFEIHAEAAGLCRLELTFPRGNGGEGVETLYDFEVDPARGD